MNLSVSFLLLIASLCAFVNEALSLKPSPVQHNYYWRDYRGELPKDAVPAMENIYIAQVLYNGLLPAMFLPNEKEAIVHVYGVKKIIKQPMKILCSDHMTDFVWKFVNINSLTLDTVPYLVIGGYNDSKTVYIGRIFHNGAWKIGRVHLPPHKTQGLVIWTTLGKLYKASDFEILTVVEQSNHEGSTIMETGKPIQPIENPVEAKKDETK